LQAFLVAVLLALVSAWLLATNSTLVRASYDWSQTVLVENSFSNSPVAIVYLDLDSFLREKQNPAQPWSRALHAQLLNRLTAAGARAVVFDIIFDAPGEDAKADADFIQAIRDNGHVVLAGEISRSSRSTGNTVGIQALQFTKPDASFLAAAAAWGVANTRMDDDFVVRQTFAGFDNFVQPSLAFAATEILSAVLSRPPAPVETPLFEPTSNSTSATRNSTRAAPGSDALSGGNWLRYYGKPLTIPHVGYSSALRADEVSDDFFRGKVVFVGARPMTGTILERKDEFRSPLSSWGDRSDLFMPAVEVHATQLLNLNRNDWLSRFSQRTELFYLAIWALIVPLLLFRFRPLAAAGIAVLLETAMFFFAAVLLNKTNIWFPWLIVGAVQIPGALAGSVLFQSLEWYRQKKKFEAQRRADESKIREQAALIEKAQDAIFVEDLAGNILYANPSAEKLYGWGDGARKKFVANETRLAEARQAAITLGEWLGEFEQNSSNGKKITVTSRCTLIRDERGEPKSLLFINTDVTEQKKLEQEFFRAQRVESIGVIAGGIAHDLNNSLSPVLMGLQMLRKQNAADETRRMLAVMEDNTHRSADMVKQVLLFSRGRDGEREPLAPGALLREMERIARQTFPKNINVAALAPADLWPVLGNATQLHQVLLNLCVNARDAMPAGGELTLAADNVELTTDEAPQIPNARPGKFVMLLVADTGVGIPPEILPRIFEPFFTTKAADKGTGLGLSTTARIVNAHGGFVNVRSEPGNGTSFEIYLPAATIAPTAEAEKKSSAPLPRGNGELVLIADDEQSVREMISLALTAQGFRVITAANGAEAVRLAQQHAAELKLILLDDDMPVMTGRAAILQIRASAPSLSIVLMSGEAKEFSDAPHVQKISKPFPLGQLLSVVAGALRQG
jgi:PAS domain S-box-containing protein